MGGNSAQEAILKEVTAKLELDEELAFKFESEARRLISLRDYRPLMNMAMILENKEAFLVFNERLSLPLKGRPGDPDEKSVFCPVAQQSNSHQATQVPNRDR